MCASNSGIEKEKIEQFVATITSSKPTGGIRPLRGGTFSVGDGVQRWLDDGEIVSLTVCGGTASGSNVEFAVNDNPYHHIWYSQLAKVFLQVEKLGQVSGAIRFKDEEPCFICRVDAQDFAKKVQGKKFKVSVNSDGMVMFPRKGVPYATYDDIIEAIKRLLKENRFDEAADLLEHGTEYDLTEV